MIFAWLQPVDIKLGCLINGCNRSKGPFLYKTMCFHDKVIIIIYRGGALPLSLMANASIHLHLDSRVASILKSIRHGRAFSHKRLILQGSHTKFGHHKYISVPSLL